MGYACLMGENTVSHPGIFCVFFFIYRGILLKKKIKKKTNEITAGVPNNDWGKRWVIPCIIWVNSVCRYFHVILCPGCPQVRQLSDTPSYSEG